METFAFILSSLAFVGMPVLAFTAIFSKAWRRRLLLVAAGLFFVWLGTALWWSELSDERARSHGFASVIDMHNATAAGITDPAVWAKHKAEAKPPEPPVQVASPAAEPVAEREPEAPIVEPVEEEAAPETDKKSACRKDLICWGDRAIVLAGLACPEHIERRAKYGVRWIDGIFEPKFSHFAWADEQRGLLTMFGDKVEFENGFGAAVRMVYECDVDPDNKAVLAVRVREGRL